MQIPPDFENSDTWPQVLDRRTEIQPFPAVYAIIHEDDFGRLNGKSRILYIGKTGQLGGASESCRLRIYRYPSGNHANNLKRKVARLTDAGVEVTFTWKYLDSEDAAAGEERRLLAEYEEEHGELPPFNSKAERGL